MDIQKIQIAICFLFCSFFGVCQINISGVVMDSVLSMPMPFSNVIIFQNDSAIKGCQTDLSGHYSMHVAEPGVYIVKAVCYNYSAKSNSLNLIKDTIIDFSLIRPLFYEQPCRQEIVQNKIRLDLPAEHFDCCEYKRIMSNTVKLDLDYLTDRKEKIYVRIWTEPAFDDYGGCVTDLIKTRKGWIAQRKYYSSNYHEYTEYLDSSDLQEPDCSGCDYDFDYFSNMKFSITSVVDTIISDGLFEKSRKNIFNNFFQMEDYCVQLREGERHPCFDGALYHLEIKSGKRYKFITFENPDCLLYGYAQAALFLDVLKIMHDNLNTL